MIKKRENLSISLKGKTFFYFSKENKVFRVVKQSERRIKQERGNIMHGKTQ